jgi:hypothetical protein
MTRHVHRWATATVLCAGLALGSLPIVAEAVTPDGEPAPGFVTWGGSSHVQIPGTTSLPAGTRVTDIAAGYDFLVGLLSDGQVRVWGAQAHAEGYDTWTDDLADTPVTAIAADSDDVMVLTEDGELRSHGMGTYLHDLDPPAELDGKTVVDFGVTYRAAAALTSDGHVVAWGHDNSTDDSAGDITHVPSSVANATVTDLDVGDNGTAVALLSTGEVVEWGYGAAEFPAAPAGDPYTQVSTGLCDTLAVTASGKVVQQPFCRFDPVPSSLDGQVVTTVETRGATALALTADHRVVQWVDPDYPQPTPNTLANRTVTAVAVGDNWQAAAVLGEFSDATATVTGQPMVGKTLTASSTSTPTAESASYQWLRDGVPIVDATGPTYIVKTPDRGHRLGVTATLSSANYDDASVESARTSAVRMPTKAFRVDRGGYRVRRTYHFTVSASGLAAGEAYTIRLAGRQLATGHASKAGKFSRSLKMPASMSLARHRLTVAGWQTDRLGTKYVRTIRR